MPFWRKKETKATQPDKVEDKNNHPIQPAKTPNRSLLIGRKSHEPIAPVSPKTVRAEFSNVTPSRFQSLICSHSTDDSSTVLPSIDARDRDRLEFFQKALFNIDGVSGNGHGFEDLLEQVFRHQGYDILKKATPGQPDKGIDLIVAKSKTVVIVQSKAWKLKYTKYTTRDTELVRSKHIDQFRGVMQKKDVQSYIDNGNTVRGCFITTSFFTPEAVKTASDFEPRIELIDRGGLFELISMLDYRIAAKVAYIKTSEEITGICDKCGSILIEKVNGSGNIFTACPRWEQSSRACYVHLL